MKRRDFLLTTAAVAAFPLAASANDTMEQYTPGLVKERLAAGETVFIEVGAAWCSTCASQKRTMAALRGENPAYDEAITFVYMDWDLHRSSDLANELEIPRRSTLVALKGDAELGRIVAGTSRADIQALMDAALSAAVS